MSRDEAGEVNRPHPHSVKGPYARAGLQEWKPPKVCSPQTPWTVFSLVAKEKLATEDLLWLKPLFYNEGTLILVKF